MNFTQPTTRASETTLRPVSSLLGLIRRTWSRETAVVFFPSRLKYKVMKYLIPIGKITTAVSCDHVHLISPNKDETGCRVVSDALVVGSVK